MKNRRSKFAAAVLATGLSLCLTQPAQARTNIQSPQKFDEFGDVPLSDIAARLDNFANELQNQPGTRAFIIVYRSRRDLPGLSGRLMTWMRNYLIQSRGLPADRVAGVDGGVADCITQELWLVPPGATPVPREDAYRNEFVDTSAARKFDEAPFYTSATYPESYGETYHGTLEGFANALRREPRSRAYIIAYAGYWVDQWEEENERGVKRTRRNVRRDPPGSARKELAAIKDSLVRKYGISPSRIRLVDGGYRKWGEVELWIVPRGVHAPIPTPNAFPKGRR